MCYYCLFIILYVKITKQYVKLTPVPKGTSNTIKYLQEISFQEKIWQQMFAANF